MGTSNITSILSYDNAPVYQPSTVPYGKNIALIGLAQGGTYNDPVYITSYNEAVRKFISGPLVDAYQEVASTGVTQMYLVCIPDLTMDSFKKALTNIEEINMHIIVPIGIYWDDTNDYGQVFVDFLSSNGGFGEAICVMATIPFDPTINVTADMIDLEVGSLYRNLRSHSYGPDGFYLSVVALSELCLFAGTPNYRISSGATIYAGLLAQIAPGASPVNKTTQGDYYLRYGLMRSALKVESFVLGTNPINLTRKPVEGSVKVTDSFESTTYIEGIDYYVNYSKGTIQAIVGRTISNPVIVNYVRDDYDTLAGAGFVTFLDFVKAGAAPACSTTQGTGDICLVQDIRVMQSIANFIRQNANDLIGICGADIKTFKTFLNKYLTSLKSSNQISDYTLTVTLADYGATINIEVDVDPQYCLSSQTLNIRIPYSGGS